MNYYILEKTKLVTIYRLKKAREFCCLAKIKIALGNKCLVI